jgi:hypothetical protein
VHFFKQSTAASLQESRKKGKLIDDLAAISAIIDTVDGTATSFRSVLASIAIDYIQSWGVLDERLCESLREIFRRMQSISGLLPSVGRYCSCGDVIYWNRSIVPFFFEEACRTPLVARQLPSFIAALNDIPTHLRYGSSELTKQFADGVMKDLEQVCVV